MWQKFSFLSSFQINSIYIFCTRNETNFFWSCFELRRYFTLKWNRILQVCCKSTFFTGFLLLYLCASVILKTYFSDLSRRFCISKLNKGKGVNVTSYLPKKSSISSVNTKLCFYTHSKQALSTKLNFGLAIEKYQLAKGKSRYHNINIFLFLGIKKTYV